MRRKHCTSSRWRLTQPCPSYRSCERYGPSLETLYEVHQALIKYGLPPITANDKSDIPRILVRLGSSAPIRVYALAAALGLDSVCVPVSQYTLQTTLDTVSEADALTMGTVYLRRLAFLHMGLTDALKQTIKEPPEEHTPHPSCPPEGRQLVKQMWDEAVGNILLQSAPHQTSPDALLGNFGPIKNNVECPRCKELIQTRISDVVQAWVSVKRTI